MGKWLDLAASLEGQGEAEAEPIGANVPIVTATDAHAQVRVGLSLLRDAPMPRTANPTVWRESVEDALRLGREGWAFQALDLGWQPIDLFGVEPVGSDDDCRNGLAVWLERRRLVLIDADSAIVRLPNGHAYFHRKRDRSGAVLLWDVVKQTRNNGGRNG